MPHTSGVTIYGLALWTFLLPAGATATPAIAGVFNNYATRSPDTRTRASRPAP
jgi:hypothetical protein